MDRWISHDIALASRGELRSRRAPVAAQRCPEQRHPRATTGIRVSLWSLQAGAPRQGGSARAWQMKTEMQGGKAWNVSKIVGFSRVFRLSDVDFEDSQLPALPS